MAVLSDEEQPPRLEHRGHLRVAGIEGLIDEGQRASGHPLGVAVPALRKKIRDKITHRYAPVPFENTASR
jgi:NAD(P)H-dependent flavin oxidoreductase YrpB (nitropropane dioxygenase family)